MTMGTGGRYGNTPSYLDFMPKFGFDAKSGASPQWGVDTQTGAMMPEAPKWGVDVNSGAMTGLGQAIPQMKPKKRGIFGNGGIGRAIAGNIGDVLLQFSGMSPIYGPSQMQQRQSLMDAERERQKLEEKQYEPREVGGNLVRLNPQSGQYDTIYSAPTKPAAPHYWETNDGSLAAIGPDGQPKVLYKDPTPKVSYQRVDNGDGTFTMVPVVNGQIMAGGGQQTPPKPVGNLKPYQGGPVQKAPGDFPVSDNGTGVISSLFPKAKITSGYRGPDHPLSKKNPRSYHARTKGAVDIAPIPGMTFQQYINAIKTAGYPIIESRDEVNNPSSHATGPHWHVVVGKKR